MGQYCFNWQSYTENFNVMVLSLHSYPDLLLTRKYPSATSLNILTASHSGSGSDGSILTRGVGDVSNKTLQYKLTKTQSLGFTFSKLVLLASDVVTKLEIIQKLNITLLKMKL